MRDLSARRAESARERIVRLDELLHLSLLALDQPAGRRCRLLAATEQAAVQTEYFLSALKKSPSGLSRATVREIEARGEDLRVIAADLLESLDPDLREDPQVRCYLRYCRTGGDPLREKAGLSPPSMPVPADAPGASIEIETHSACIIRAIVLALLGLFGCWVGAFFVEAVQYRPEELGALAPFPPILLGLCFAACFRALHGSYLALQTVTLRFRDREIYVVSTTGRWRRQKRLRVGRISEVWSTEGWWPMRLLRWLIPSQAPASGPYIILRHSGGCLRRLTIGGFGEGGSSEQVASRIRVYLGIGPEAYSFSPSPKGHLISGAGG